MLRRAFSLIELVVVLGIFAVLTGLLLSAIQKVRATAARLQCANQLRQLALASHQYHDLHDGFPAGVTVTRDGGRMLYASWLTQLLPLVEQEALWRTTQEAYHQTTNPFQNPPHRGLSTPIDLFGCPADPRTKTPQLAIRSGRVVALSSYLGVSGRSSLEQDGVYFRDSRVRLIDIRDGTSQTLLIGERPPSNDHQFGWWYAGLGQQQTGSADSVLGVEEWNLLGRLRPDCPAGPYRFAPAKVVEPCAMFHFWSLHPGGAWFALADGSSRFIAYPQASILPALASREGGEIISDLP
jgi:prepilin-type N-terminal cleavage/methylation domain-containing protein